MTAKNMPGFTAGLSLKGAMFRYVSRQAGSTSRGVSGIVPSLVTPPWAPHCSWPCYVDNHGDCVCPTVGPPPPFRTFWP